MAEQVEALLRECTTEGAGKLRAQAAADDARVAGMGEAKGAEEMRVVAGGAKVKEARARVNKEAESPCTGAGPVFDIFTPMLVMPFLVFRQQGRIFKSVKPWRDEAMAQRRLVEYDKAGKKKNIFISHASSSTLKCM